MAAETSHYQPATYTSLSKYSAQLSLLPKTKHVWLARGKCAI